MQSIRWIFFGVMIAAQLAVPAYMIADSEQTLQHGVAYKFRCGPVDPYDAFRGRYVALAFLDNQVENWTGPAYQRDTKVFVSFHPDEDGFAQIDGVSVNRPDRGENYLVVTVSNSSASAKTLRVRFPFDRYYMDEYQAPAAEAAYRAQRGTEEGAHVVVRVRNGVGVIEGLFLGDKSVEAYLREVATGK